MVYNYNMSNNDPIIIDNTQYSSFMQCEGYWTEKYVNKVHKPWDGERDDPMSVGIGFHDLLFNGYKNGVFEMTPKVAQELTLTMDATKEISIMGEYYRSQYPSGPVEFDWVGLEEPLAKPVNNDIILKAKVDGFFINNKERTISGGVEDIHLVPGIYGFETKSKLPGYDRGFYLSEWQAAMQASFQLLTIKHNSERLGFNSDDVKGILVNVIERPNVYEPRRTCKGCSTMFQTKLYRLEGKNYICPMCEHPNTFTGPFPSPRVDPPYAYRFLVNRSPERLEVDQDTIIDVAMRMKSIRDKGTYPVLNRTNCVIVKWKKKCEYYEPHNGLIPVDAIEYPGYKLFNPTAYLER